MSSLPSAHASQRFGRRQIEFFAVSGQVSEPEGRMRGNARRIQDLDGANHSVRLADRDGALDPGDSVALLRLQAGPERGSRAVSAINYTQNTWVEIGPGASASLARTGVSRAGAWWFAMLAFMAAAIAIVWSDLRTFLVEVNDALFGILPDFHLIAWLDAQLPFLRGYDLAAQVPGLSDLIGSSGIVETSQSNLVFTAALLSLLILVAFGARTWRIVWVPVFILAALAAGLMLGGEAAAEFSLAILGVAALFFALAGLINRIRDAARLRGRIARLSDHLLRHPPVESVTTPPPPRRDAPAMSSPSAATAPSAATTASMAAVAAAVAGDDSVSDAREAQDAADAADGNTSEDDDLPSDAELEAARASLTGDDQPDPAPLSNRSTGTATSLDVDEPNDRDMILPPPPPMAGPAENASAGETGDGEAETQDTDMSADAPEPVVADTGETQTSLEAETPADSADVIIPETVRDEPPARDTATSTADEEGEDGEDGENSPLDLSGPDPMTSDDEAAETPPASDDDGPRRT